MSIQSVIELARAELGYTEAPKNSNRVKYWTEYDPAFQGQQVETWKDVIGYKGVYEVSSLGRVRNSHGKVLRPIERRGYLSVNLCLDGVSKDKKIHRLVAEAFLPNPMEFPQINHLDEDKHNNAVSNLEWCTASHNCNYGTHNARVSASKTGKKPRWTSAGLEKLRMIKSKPVIGVHKKTGEIIRFQSATEAEKHGFSRYCVQRVANGHEKSYKGFVWMKESAYGSV